MEKSAKRKKTCGNCATIQPLANSKSHVVCMNCQCKSCDCLKSVNSAGCKHWSEGVGG